MMDPVPRNQGGEAGLTSCRTQVRLKAAGRGAQSRVEAIAVCFLDRMSC